MNKNIKYALVFTSGVAVGFGVCGYKVLKYVLNDDGVCSVISDKISNRIVKTIYRDDRVPRRNCGSRVSYRRYRRERFNRKMDLEYDDVIFETRKDALNALEKMSDIIFDYGFATVADLYDLNNIDCPYTASKYGWTNLRNCEVLNTDKGYVINLPKPFPID